MTTEEHPEEADVQRLLAAAARPEPSIPADVAARLDARLAELTVSRTSSEAPAGVTSGSGSSTTESARPGRRRWPQLLVAAAAVSVLGLGVGNLLVGPTSEESSQTAGSAAEDRGGSGADDRAPEASTLQQDSAGHAGNGPVRLRTRSLTADVQRVQDSELAIPSGADARRQDACVPPPTTEGTSWLPVRLDGEPALLVLGVPNGGGRLAEVYRCERPGTPAATTRVLVR